MDVHHVALTNRGDVGTRNIALFVVILIDHGDNLLLGQVEDIRLAAHIERRSLGRRDTVDGEVGLPVSQAIVAFATYHQSDGHFIFIRVGSCLTTSYRGVRYADAFCILAYLIAFTAEVEDFIFIIVCEGQRSDIRLIGVSQAVVSVLRDDGAHSVWRITDLEGALDHIDIASSPYIDGRIMALLVRQFLEVRA